MFIKSDLSDQMFYNEYLEESEELKKHIDEGKKRHFAYEEVGQDLFSLFYKLEPEEVETPTPMAMHMLKQALDTCRNMREYQELREMTQLDAFTSGVATRAMGEYMLKLMPKVGDKDPQDIEEQLKKLSNKKFAGQAEKDANDKKMQDLQQQLDKANAANKQAEDAQLDSGQLRRVVRNNLKQAIDQVEQATDALETFAGTDPGQLQQVGLEEKMKIAKSVQKSRKLAEIAKLAGRFCRIARKKQQEKSTATEINNIENGNHLPMVLASEFALLNDPLLQLLFYKGFAERALLQYKLEGKEPQGKGPIIICIDGSGSMSGMPEYASKGIALALMEIARKQNRDFVLMQFGSSYELRTFTALKGKCDYMQLLAELEFFFNGGTDFQRPLTESLKFIEQSAFKQADIIFITDGYCGLDSKFLESYHKVKEEKKFSCYGILIGGDANGCKPFCDDLFNTDDLLGSKNDDMHEAIFKV